MKRANWMIRPRVVDYYYDYTNVLALSQHKNPPGSPTRSSAVDPPQIPYTQPHNTGQSCVRRDQIASGRVQYYLAPKKDNHLSVTSTGGALS